MPKFKVTVTGRKGKPEASFTTIVEAEDVKAAQRFLEYAMFRPRFAIVEAEAEKRTPLRLRND